MARNRLLVRRSAQPAPADQVTPRCAYAELRRRS